MSSCFINFILNSFAISYWMYFAVIEGEKNLKKEKMQDTLLKFKILDRLIIIEISVT